MKKFISVVLLLMAGATAYAQDSLEKIENGWKTKTITNVVNGSLGIMLERFDQTWPTGVVGDARSVMEQGLAEKVLDAETGYRVINDAKNGYVEVSDDGADNGYMSACVWNRSNGHRLFAVVVGQPVDPEIEVACFYDYDPQKKTLTPETNLLSGWNPQHNDSELFYGLPHKGKDLCVRELLSNKYEYIVHHFRWDGMKPVFDHSDPIADYSEPDIQIDVKFKGAQPTISDFVSAILSQEDLGESLGAISNDWTRRQQGRKLNASASFIVDERNGYIRYDFPSHDGYTSYTEFCYWNCADGKHKLVALSHDAFENGKPIAGQYTGIDFYLYNNATHQLTNTYANEWGVKYDIPEGEHVTTCSLPRTGKNLQFTIYTANGKISNVLTWNGNGFK
ncbi:MAG: hypothetical protein IJ635_06840 [Bacteroidaceae bacterium]|nr:hypothetical protein [Bacteroidaceae bacterium]